MIEIRDATLDDVDVIVAIGRRAHERSANARYRFSEGRARILVATCICRGSMSAIVAVAGSEVVGFLLGQIDAYPYIDMEFATDLAVVSEVPGAGRKLIEAFTRWAFDKHADQIILGVVNGGKDSAALYKRMGFQHVGGMFTKNRRS